MIDFAVLIFYFVFHSHSSLLLFLQTVWMFSEWEMREEKRKKIKKKTITRIDWRFNTIWFFQHLIVVVVVVFLPFKNGTFLAPTITIPMMMFAGFGVTLRDLPGYMKWGSHISFMRYGLEGFVGAIYGGDRQTLACDNAMYCHYRYKHLEFFFFLLYRKFLVQIFLFLFHSIFFHSTHFILYYKLFVYLYLIFRYPKQFLNEISMGGDQFWPCMNALFITVVLLRLGAYFLLRWKVVAVR